MVASTPRIDDIENSAFIELSNTEITLNKTWFGAQVYSKSFNLSFSMTTGAEHVIATTVIGLEVIGIKGTLKQSGTGNWYEFSGLGTGGGLSYIRYDDLTGNIIARWDGATFVNQKVTLEYTKP